MLNEIVKLKTTISWVHKVHCGPNFTDRGKGYTHGCVIEIWGPRQYLNEYLTHPDHLALREKYISKIVETDGLLALDYEFPESLTLRR
ncbi:hypothetical protein BKA69DRAFT_1128070 [Paraphysoderma sedebokerense]|nr:hypothetical protein BKA69DRAFT_1128070 [Paraphysoderma sedebokerense]